MKSMEPDILAKLKHDFKEELPSALARLESVDQHLQTVGFGTPQRLLRCLVFAADGKLKSLDEAIELCIQDVRDLMVAAEYEPGTGLDELGMQNLIRVRDLSLPFQSNELPK
ncbi:MAG: hypothetical protein ACYTDT_01120 [Planctomycetota bacterium]|jgi:hypothetical protein